MSDGQEQLDLVPSGASEQASSDVPAAEHGDWILTNRFNLLEILSSGLIAPARSYTKHYRDLLDLSGEQIVILRRRPDPALLASVASEGTNNFPVLLELERDSIIGPAGAAFTTVCAPTSVVRAIHLPSPELLRDHIARPYDNVPDATDDRRLRSSPALFVGGDLTTDDVQACLDIGPRDRPSMDWRTIDRVRGSASALVAAAASCVNLDLVADALKGSAGSVLEACLTVADPEPGTQTLDAESALGLAVVKVLGHTDAKQAWSPRKVLAAVAKLIEPTASGASAEIKRNLTALRGIVTGERGFEGFREESQGLTSAKALLLVLLRPELSRLLDWPRAETNADDATALLAAAWVGRLRGLTIEAQSLRNARVDGLTADWACAVAADGPSHLQLTTTVVRDQHGARLLLGDQILCEVTSVTEDVLQTWRSLAEEDQRHIAAQLAETFHVEARRTVLHTPGTVTVEKTESGLRITITGPAEIDQTLDDSLIVEALRSQPKALEIARRSVTQPPSGSESSGTTQG